MARTRSNTPAAVKNAAPIDLAALAQDTRVSKPTTGGSRFANNPFVAILRDSFNADESGENGWRENTMAGYHVFDFTAALRHATTVLADEGIGVRIRYSFVDDEGRTVEQGNLRDVTEKDSDTVVKYGVPEDDRDVTVKYTGRRRKVYGADGSNGNGSDVDGDDGDDTDDTGE